MTGHVVSTGHFINVADIKARGKGAELGAVCYEIQDEAQYNPEIHDNFLKTGIKVQSILCRDLTVSRLPTRPLSRSALRYAYIQRRRSPRRRLCRQQERHLQNAQCFGDLFCGSFRTEPTGKRTTGPSPRRTRTFSRQSAKALPVHSWIRGHFPKTERAPLNESKCELGSHVSVALIDDKQTFKEAPHANNPQSTLRLISCTLEHFFRAEPSRNVLVCHAALIC